VQNDFLLQVQPVYSYSGSVTIEEGDRIYPAPSDAIRVERISIEGDQLFDVSEDDLDTEDADWPTYPGTPTAWYQNKIGPQNIGFKPLPQIGASAEVWYSQRASTAVLLSDNLFVPDVFWPAVKNGILARAFQKDGEQRDQTRSLYYQRRYQLWVQISKRLMMGVAAEIKSPKVARAGT